jgi:hypothetical protein
VAMQVHPGTHHGMHVSAKAALEVLLIGMVGVALVGLIVLAGTNTSSSTALNAVTQIEARALADFRLSEKAPALVDLRVGDAQFRLSEKTEALTPEQLRQAESNAQAQFRLSEKSVLTPEQIRQAELTAQAQFRLSEKVAP